MSPSPLDDWIARRTTSGAAPDALLHWQMAELRRTLAWAARNSPFHARRLAAADVDALAGPGDLFRLPRMEPGDLAAPGLLAVSQDDVARVVTLATSGSSGPPKRLFFSEGDLARTLDFFAVGMSTLCGAGDGVLVLLPGRTDWGVADLLARALPRIGARAVLPSPGWTPDDLPALLGEGVRTLVAAPTHLRRLLDALPPEAFRGRLATLLSSAEPLPAVLRERIETAWGCEVFDHWGMTETGYGGGVECRAHAGYHLREADLFVEVADFATGAPLPEGETGELLVTTLGERALPLVRYRTGDAGRMLPGPCPCGSRLRRLDAVPGRFAPDGSSINHQPKGWVCEA
jgi:phenylacetate-coenzyme A ligase PaaK-like adenylate-forming protein